MSGRPDPFWPEPPGQGRVTRPRGQPIVALLLLLGSWVAVRAVLLGESERPGEQTLAVAGDVWSGGDPSWPRPASVSPAGPLAAGIVRQSPADRVIPEAPRRPKPVPVREASRQPADAAERPRLAGGHQMLWLAGLAMVPLPPEAVPAKALRPLPPRSPAGRGEARPGPDRQSLPRWSADGWIMWRQGGNGYNLPGSGLLLTGQPSGTYGASQAGLVIRYRLAPSSALRPTLFLRATSALRPPRGEEVAAGLSVRPVKRIPVAAIAELRAVRTPGGAIIARPAAGLVSELGVLRLPLGMETETYVAAGYVAGREATAFVDGQARIERPAARIGPFDLRAGGGAWGGAQRGAQRLDIGPSATLAFPLPAGGARLRADWRFRVLGDAAPASGPALTLSAGF